jgi:MoaA/NifB/PqqE/SkfB family radical SAM enzyme
MQTIDVQQAIQEIANAFISGAKARYFFFAGAGVSTPQVPLASAIVQQLRSKDRRHDVRDPEQSPLAQYSAILKAVYPSREGRRQYFQDLIRDKPIPPACLRLAYLLTSKKCPNVLVTPNFDDFFARACELSGQKCDVYERAESIPIVQWSTDRPKVAHIHGTYRDYDIANLRGELSSIKGVKDALLHLLHDRSPLVLGYSGWQDDVFMGALRKHLGHQNSLLYPLYWFCHDANSLSSLPAWLKNHPDVNFVVADQQDISRRLHARDVLQDLINALHLPPPALSVDPIGVFLQRVRESLEYEPDAPEWRDLYLFSQRLRGLYPNRAALGRTYHPVQVMKNAKEGSRILSAGRTLRAWAACFHEIIYFAKHRGLSFQFLLSDESATTDLGQLQQDEVKRDRGRAVARFDFLEQILGTRCEVHETPHLIIDGITVSEVEETAPVAPAPQNMPPPSRLTCQFDINAASDLDKPTLVLACTCGVAVPNRPVQDERRINAESFCTTHGLLDRTLRIYSNAHKLDTQSASPFQRLAWLHEESLSVRNNSPQTYLTRLRDIFESIDADNVQDLPPPLCVQANISSACGTRCQMCDHWTDPDRSTANLSSDEWRRVFANLDIAAKASRVVTTLVLSGGEPLALAGIESLLEFVKTKTRLRIGLLTSGLIEGSAERRHSVRSAVRTCVDWVAVSVDGTETADRDIRKPCQEFENRWKHLKEFCGDLLGGPTLSATVTLQAGNIGVAREDICSFIHDLGIDTVNFKFATGGAASLGENPRFLIDNRRLDDFFESLWRDPLVNEPRNNLSYLRRCLAAGFFTADDVAFGTPVRTLYDSHPTRCFTPFLFGLIDATGKVYPCCHLYRDNHGRRPNTHRIRAEHILGDVRPDFDFARVWGGEQYNLARRRLETVRPSRSQDAESPDFSPCGECTRHFQHNLALTAFYKAYKENPVGFKEWYTQYADDREAPVWF